MRRLDVIVTLSAVHKQPLSVPEWEIPLLARVHGGQVEIVGESRCDMRVPDPGDEYARLVRRYGRNKETLVPHIEEVYGADSIGVRKLADAMRPDMEEQLELDGVVATQAAEQASANRGESAQLNASEPAPAGKGKRGAGGK
jgi:hypothetical protein